MGIDDVPIVALTFYPPSEEVGAYDIERIAHSVEAEIKRVPGTREVQTIGGPGHVVNIYIEPSSLNAVGLTVIDIRQALTSANLGLPVGDLLSGNLAVQIEAGGFLASAQDRKSTRLNSSHVAISYAVL